MKLNRFIQIILGRDRKFFLHFEKISSNLIDISKLLNELVTSNSFERRIELASEIDKLEEHGDRLTHEMFNELSANFITPFDREDIHALITAIDDVVDYIHGSAKRITMYKQQSISPAMQNLAELVMKGAKELHIAVCGLRNIQNSGIINAACARIKSIESHADAVYNSEMSKLFDENNNGVELIKVMEILQNLEIATDKCEDAAKVMGAILMKNT